MDIISYILSKKYTDNTVDGLGAIKGAPCTVKSVVDIDGGKRITLEWESNSGVKQTQSFDIMNGEDGANTVEWSQIQQSGTKIAELNINGVSTDVYAPTGGGGTGDVADVEVNGVSVLDPDDKIAKITSYKEVTESEYEAIPVAERENNGVAYFIKDLNNKSVQGYPPLIYSDEEREIGVWRDGKPLYQKTFELGTLESGQNVGKSLGLVNIDKIFLVMDGSWFTHSGTHFPIPYIHYTAGNLVGILFEVSASDVMAQFRIGSGMSGAVENTILTVRYTKTTDTAGSGIWNGQGGYAHHYSTNETVVGTWIDGSTLYEKTIAYTPSETISSNTTIANIPDAKVMRVTGATAYNPSDNRGYTLPDVRANGGTKITYDDGDVVLEIISDSWSSSWTFYVTIQYTKTTD